MASKLETLGGPSAGAAGTPALFYANKADLTLRMYQNLPAYNDPRLNLNFDDREDYGPSCPSGGSEAWPFPSASRRLASWLRLNRMRGWEHSNLVFPAEPASICEPEARELVAGGGAQRNHRIVR